MQPKVIGSKTCNVGYPCHIFVYLSDGQMKKTYWDVVLCLFFDPFVRTSFRQVSGRNCDRHLSHVFVFPKFRSTLSQLYVLREHERRAWEHNH